MDSGDDRLGTFLVLSPREARTVAALFERLFPADELGSGATEIGALAYLDRALAGPYANHAPTYRLGVAALDRAAHLRWAAPFAAGVPAAKDALLVEVEHGLVPDWVVPGQQLFFELARAHLQEGLFADPAHGGNRDKLGWRFLGHPGVWLENSAEENLSPHPVTKNGKVKALADVREELAAARRATGGDRFNPAEIGGFDPQRGAIPPTPRADVLLIGMGGVGGFLAPIFCEAGLNVVGLEAGPWRALDEYLPDELGATYYCRGILGPKFNQEIPRWRRKQGEATSELTFSLGRMMNGVGGSIVHYGAWLRRFHPHHLRLHSHAIEQWGRGAIPEGSTVADWPIPYDELEPYFSQVEAIVGVAGDEQNPFVPRTAPYPLPAPRPFRLGELFAGAARELGLHPHMAAVGMTTAPYHDLPEMSYTAWNNGFGSWTGDKWHPALTSVPQALATGNLDLRTGCRVTRIVTDRDGRARGVEYIDPLGALKTQEADTVILCAYTFENVRLLFLSGDDKHTAGLGNNAGQLGQHFMTKMFPHVDGLFPDTVFNRHTGPAAQAVVCDDFLAADFDSVAHGFLGGSTLGAENQFLPIQIARETLPPEVPRWGSGYKAHLKAWQHLGVVRMQPEALSYQSNFLDLDPHHRDKSGLGLPVLRVTYDLHQNERRQASFFEGKSEEILHAMGATKTWQGPSFTGAGSSHDLGGCRSSDAAANGVVDRHLRVHDTPGLYVFSGAVMPTCPGINPTMTLWALCLHAAEGLIRRLRAGEER